MKRRLYWLAVSVLTYVLVFIMLPMEIDKIGQLKRGIPAAEGYSGSCGVWAMKSGDFVATNFNGDVAGITAAIAYCTATGGTIQIGPGCEALAWMPDSLPPNVQVVQASWAGWRQYGRHTFYDKWGQYGAQSDSVNLDLRGYTVNGDIVQATGQFQLTRARPIKWANSDGGYYPMIDVNYLDYPRFMGRALGGTGHMYFLMQGDTVNKAIDISAISGHTAGTVTIGSAAVNYSLTVNGGATFAQDGLVNVQGRAVVWDTLRVGVPTQKGEVFVSGKAVVDDSLRANKGVYIGGQFLQKVLTATASLDFDLTSNTCQDLTMTVTGAAVGDAVMLGAPTEPFDTGGETSCSAWGYVSAANTVTVRMCRDGTGVDPTAGTFRATVLKF